MLRRFLLRASSMHSLGELPHGCYRPRWGTAHGRSAAAPASLAGRICVGSRKQWLLLEPMVTRPLVIQYTPHPQSGVESEQGHRCKHTGDRKGNQYITKIYQKTTYVERTVSIRVCQSCGSIRDASRVP